MNAAFPAMKKPKAIKYKKLDHALSEIARLEHEVKYGRVAMETVLPILRDMEQRIAKVTEENEKLREDLDYLSGHLADVEAAHAYETARRRHLQSRWLFRILKPLLGKYRVAPPVARSRRPERSLAGSSLELGKDGLQGNLDYPAARFERIPNGTCLFSGWMLDEDWRPPRRVTLHFNNQAHDCALFQHRGDLREFFDALPPRAENAGFQGRIELPVGLSRVAVEVEFEGKKPFVAFERDLLHIPVMDDGFSQRQAIYEDWIRRFDDIRPEQHKVMVRQQGRWAWRPLVSVVIPVFRPEPDLLEEAVESVRRQVYPEWELILVEDCSGDGKTWELLQTLEGRDARIRALSRSENGGISRATWDGVEAARGEFVAFFDQDDILRPHALFHVVEYLQEHPETGLIYSDEDKVDREGGRFEPYFKPDWNPELLTSQNYISHLSVIRREVLRETGPLNPELDGAQDWDLLLRVTERLRPDQIGHIHRILYHWRSAEGSTAWHEGEKDTRKISVRVLEHCLQRRGEQGCVEVVDGKYFRIRRALPEVAPLVEMIIPTRDRLEDLKTCVESILEKTDYPRYRITIVNNRSQDPKTFAFFDQCRERGVRILDFDGDFNFSAINNYAVEQAEGEVLALLNNDLEVTAGDWLEAMVAEVLRPEVGVVGCKLLYGNDTIQHAGVILGVGGVAGHAFKYLPRGYDGQMMRAHLLQNFSAVTAACCLVRREVFLEVGGFDAENLKVAFNDVDFCLRVRECGYRNVYVPVELYHHESRSRGPEDTAEKQERFQREVDYMKARWGKLLEEDPAYNRNLTLDLEDFSLSTAPRHPNR